MLHFNLYSVVLHDMPKACFVGDIVTHLVSGVLILLVYCMREGGPEKRDPTFFFVLISKRYSHRAAVWVMVSRHCPAAAENLFFHGNGIAEHAA